MINQHYGFSTNTVRRYMAKLGVKRNLSESRKLAVQEGRLHLGSKPGKDCIGWKGGRNISSKGYVKIYVDTKDPYHIMADRDHYISEHRLVMAKHLNRPLASDEWVHHLNGIKTDNRIRNLALVNHTNHPTKTFLKLLQLRIRDLEAQLAQQKLI